MTGEFDWSQITLVSSLRSASTSRIRRMWSQSQGVIRATGRFRVFRLSGATLLLLRHSLVTWPSGIAGVQFDVPDGVILNNDYVKRSMADAFAADSWIEVRGPDSLLLK